LIIKNIYHKIRIHPLFWVIALASILTGMFREFIMFSSLILVHELGHAIMAYLLKFKITSINLYPFGGLTVFDILVNHNLFKELLILIAGPFMQVCYFYVHNYFLGYDILFNHYHYILLIFNFLPIHPLDGSKFLNIILSKIIPFKKAHLSIIIISYITAFASITIVLLNKNIWLTIIIFYLLSKVINEYHRHHYLFNKFLFERYFYNFKFKKHKIIWGSNLNKMYYSYYHLFNIDNKIIMEKEMLRKKFDLWDILW